MTEQLTFEFEPSSLRRHAASCCDGSCVVHMLMPNMAYACYETILTVGGHFLMASSEFDNVTCPGCRAEGVEQIRRRRRWQQGLCVHCGGRLAKSACPNKCIDPEGVDLP